MKKYLKRLWGAIWASTELDEKAIAAIEIAKNRVEMMKLELEDVKKAAKNVVAQSKDVVDAAKGKKRRGRKPYYKNKNKTNNNSKK
jgi:hypothetical protein